MSSKKKYFLGGIASHNTQLKPQVPEGHKQNEQLQQVTNHPLG